MDHSSSSSGIFFQGDGQSQVAGTSQQQQQQHYLSTTTTTTTLPQVAGTSHLSYFGNSSNSIPGNIHSNMVPVPGDVSNTVLNSVANSGPSVGASSLVTDANSGLSGGPRLQRSASINNESYMRLPASPMSFSSNNISISGSSAIDGPSGMTQSSNHDPNSHQVHPGHPRQGASTATSLPPPRNGQVSLPNGSRVLGSFMQDNDNVYQLQKKPRLDIKHEDAMDQQASHQYMQRRDSVQLQSTTPQFQALMMQQRLRHQQQQILQSLPPVQRAHLLQQQQQQQQQQQLQLRQQLQQQSMQPSSSVKRPYDGGGGDSVCSRRLMQYLYHQRQRPADNPIAYWRKFVSEYYSPRAKKRWCLSLYDNVAHHSLGVFPQAAMDAWRCEICGSKSGRGFEATFEVLPRLNEIKFGSGVIDELLFLDCPHEFRFSTGIMMLEYKKAVQESVYEQLRVVREGRLRILFSPDLKILSWEFCVQRHEELLPRRLVAPQVNQLLQVAQKCQATIAESGPDGVSKEDLQTNSNMVVTAGRQLARSLELQSLNDLGFSKRYVRCLQISEVVNSMKDLMDFCKKSKVGPIDGLKNYPRQASSAKLQLEKMQEMDRMTNIQGLPTDGNALSKLVAHHPGLNNPINSINNHPMVNRGAPLNSSAQALAISNYQNLLMRQNSMKSNSQQEASSSYNNFSPSPFQGSSAILPGVVQNNNIPINGFLSSSHLLQQRSLSGNVGIQQQNHSQGASQALQHQMMQQLLQDMKNNNNGGGATQSISGQSGASMSRDGPRYGNNNNLSGGTSSPHVNGGSGGSGGPPGPTRSNSFKAASHSDSSAGGGNIGGASQKTQDVQQNVRLSEEMVLQDIANEFTDNDFFDNVDFEDSMWKA